MLLHGGEWNGRQIIPRDYMKELTVPSPTEPVYALGIWLANNEHQAKEDEPPFEAAGIFYLDGHSKQRVYVVPDKDLVVVRVGENGARLGGVRPDQRGPARSTTPRRSPLLLEPGKADEDQLLLSPAGAEKSC